jgi:hypothetical protein
MKSPFKTLMVESYLGEVCRSFTLDGIPSVEVVYNLGEEEPTYQCYANSQFFGKRLPKVGTKVKITTVVEACPDNLDHGIDEELMAVAREG